MTITDVLLFTKSLVIVSWFAAFFIMEHLSPADNWKPKDDYFSQSGHMRGNLGLWFVNLLLSRLLVIPVTLAAVNMALDWRPAGAGPLPWILLAVDIVVLDAWIYWWHRYNHEIPFLWRFHQVHHLDQQLDSTTALRFHFGEVALSALVRAPVIILMGMPFSSVIVFETLVLMAAMFHHSNARLPSWVETSASRVLITPGIHWVHHHAVRADTDSNYGTLFSFWDRLFGSVGPGSRQPGMALGLAGVAETRFGRLLLLPFQSDRS